MKKKLTGLVVSFLLLSNLFFPLHTLRATEFENAISSTDLKTENDSDGETITKEESMPTGLLEESSFAEYSNDTNIKSAIELQRDLQIEAINPEIESGQDGIFKLILKTTGSQIKYNNAKIEVELPLDEYVRFEQNLEELAIEGIKPTFNEKEKKLEYQFETLKSGRTYEKNIKLTTENGYIFDGKVLKASSSLKLTINEEDSTILSQSEIRVRSSKVIDLGKKRIKTEYQGQSGVAQPNGSILWEINVSFPFKESGMLFIKPGTKINVIDTLPRGLTFSKMETSSDITPKTIKNNVVSWEYIAPSVEDQMNQKDKGIFSTKIKYWTTIDSDKNFKEKLLTNTVSTDAVFLDNDKVSQEAKASVRVYESTGNTGEIEGGIVVSSHLGPKDSRGSAGFDWDMLNPNPIGNDSSLFRFGHAMYTMYYGRYHDLKELEYIYTIDPNLKLEKLVIPSADFLMGTTKEEISKKMELPIQPKFDMKFTYLDKSGKLQSKLVEDPPRGSGLSLEDFGLDNDYQITEVRFIFKDKIPKKFYAYNVVNYLFSVKKGYVGEVKNKFDIIGQSTYNPATRTYSKGDVFYKFDYRKDFPNLYEEGGSKNISGDRTAQVVPRGQSIPPKAKINISLKNHKNGTVEQGSNRLLVHYQTVPTSAFPISNPLESVTLLPPGVTINEEKPNDAYTGVNKGSIKGNYKILSTNYNNSGRQLVKFIWDADYIRIGNNVTAEIDINIADNAPSHLKFDVYGFSGDPKLSVPEVEKPVLTDTILQVDMEDLNDNKNKDQPRIKSSNAYNMISSYDLQTEKFVKGPNEKWSKLAKTTLGGDIDYKLHMTNTTGKNISNMTLIDVLPSVGDLGITDNISRGSQFTPLLTGPITLPKEWEGKVEVLYSNSKNPERNDLIRYVKYPKNTLELSNPESAEAPKWIRADSIKDWSKIHSFKIELLPGKTWIKGVDMDVIFKMKAPKVEELENISVLDIDKDISERAAWNSFAVATDEGQPVEPFQVGVIIDPSLSRLDVIKIDADDNRRLKEAEFELYQLKNKEKVMIHSSISNDEGKLSFEKLKAGTYYIEEIKAPNGYQKLKEPIEFELDLSGKFKINSKNMSEFISLDKVKNSYQLTIKNTLITGGILPETGGEGNLYYYLIAGILMFVTASLAVYYWYRSRKGWQS